MRAVSHGVLPVLSAALLTLTACGTEDRSGPVEVYTYAYTPELDRYALRPTWVENLESLRGLRGRDLRFRNGAWLEVTQSQAGGFRVHEGGDFELEYDVDSNGVVIPSDLHSLYAVSAYRALDLAAQAVRAQGFVPHAPLNGYYFPELTGSLVGDQRGALTDNAAFAAGARGFLFVPSFALAEPPLLVHEWVMAHEFGHAVVHQQLFGAQPAQPEFAVGAERHLQSLHEGAADLLAVGVTGEPDGFRFIQGIKTDRNVAEPRSFTPSDAVEAHAGDAFDPHHQGSLLARAIYETWKRKDATGKMNPQQRADFLRAVLEALGRLEVNAEFNLADFANEWVKPYTELERAEACTQLLVRLSPYAKRLTACAEATP